MRNKLILLLATVSVAITLGRETSASSQVGKLADQFNPTSELSLCGDDTANLAFLPPTGKGPVAFLPPTGKGPVAFLPPTGKGPVAFLPPTGKGPVAFLPLTGNLSVLSTAIRTGDLKSSVRATKFAMLPLGTETGRHVRNLDAEKERSTNSNGAKAEASSPVAQLTKYLSDSYAMLPLGTETGRHVRNLDEGNERSTNSDAAKVQAPIPVA